MDEILNLIESVSEGLRHVLKLQKKRLEQLRFTTTEVRCFCLFVFLFFLFLYIDNMCIIMSDLSILNKL